MIAVVVVASILLVGGLIYLGYQSQVGPTTTDMSQYPALGDPNAPVTMIEYSDYG
jgi:hypothetical protein